MEMLQTADILITLDCSSSMNWIGEKLVEDCFDGFVQYLRPDSEELRLGLNGFRSHHDQIERYEFTSSSETFQNYLDQIRILNELPNGSKGIALALEAGLTFNWRFAGPDFIHEKIMILFTDGPPCGIFDEQERCSCNDIWHLANRYIQEDISIFVVGIEPGILIVDDFYCALAQKTGGYYFPLKNGPRILRNALSNWVYDRGIFSDFFRRLDLRMDIQLNSQYDYGEMKNRVDFMLTCCRSMSDIHRDIYSYLSKRTQRALPVESMSSLLHRSWSTPVTIPRRFNDDEGYLSAMPTVASFNSLPSIILSDNDEYSPLDDDEHDTFDIFN